MKSKMLIAVIAALLVATIALSSFAGARPADTYSRFILDVTGTANVSPEEVVTVSLSIQGNLDGKQRNVFHLKIKGGDATIEGYEAISAVKGEGTIINKNNFIRLNIMMSALYYGGRNTLWVLKGTTEPLNENSMSIDLQAPRIVLPVNDYPQLTNLDLSGTITLLQ